MELRRRAFQIVGENAAVDFRRATAEFIDRRVTPARAPKIGAKTAHRCIDVLGFLDPRRCKTIHAEQMMRHPQARIRVYIELDWLALAREVIELASLDRLPNLSLRYGFPLIQTSVCHKNWQDLLGSRSLGARIEQ